MRDFSTAAKRQKIEEEGDQRESIKFKYDDREITCYRPTPGQIVAVMSVEAGIGSTEDQQIAAYINFFHAILDPADADYFKRRLLDGRDPFEFEEMYDLMQALMEEWAQRPTKQSLDSAISSARSLGASTETSPSGESTSGDLIYSGPAI